LEIAKSMKYNTGRKTNTVFGWLLLILPPVCQFVAGVCAQRPRIGGAVKRGEISHFGETQTGVREECRTDKGEKEKFLGCEWRMCMGREVLSAGCLIHVGVVSHATTSVCFGVEVSSCRLVVCVDGP